MNSHGKKKSFGNDATEYNLGPVDKDENEKKGKCRTYYVPWCIECHLLLLLKDSAAVDVYGSWSLVSPKCWTPRRDTEWAINKGKKKRY